jgi:hypothetical protein
MPTYEQVQFLAIIGVGFAIGFPSFLIWLQYIARNKTLKYTYQDIAQKNPEVEEYLNQGYHLLTIARDKALIGEQYFVYNYPTKYNLNTFPLFKLSFESSTTHYHNKECSQTSSTEDYTEWLPFQSQIKKQPFVTTTTHYYFTKNDIPFLTVLYPGNNPFLELYKEQTSSTLTGTAIPKGQSWEWQINNKIEYKNKLVDVTNHNRILLASFPSKGFSFREVLYLVIHPEMPKHLVPAFVYFSLLVQNGSSCSSN